MSDLISYMYLIEFCKALSCVCDYLQVKNLLSMELQMVVQEVSVYLFTDLIVGL